MERLLEQVKKYPTDFQIAIAARSKTTPSEVNRANHIALYTHIGLEEWDEALAVMSKPEYRRPLEGVVYCLEAYSGMDKQTWHEICNLLDVIE